MTAALTNWAGNVAYRARRLHHPSTVEELRRLVAGARRIRALGTGHSFSDIADCPGGDLVSLAGLPPVVDIDAAGRTVTVGAAVRYGELATRLHAAGLALPNLGSLPHISVAGACATGTHGSGDRNGNLATAVRALRLVTADGDQVRVDRDGDPDTFAAMVVGLGCFGVVTELTLGLVPTFRMRQDVYEDLPRERFDEHGAEIFASGYSVSVFTRWRGPRIDQVWRKRRVDGTDRLDAPLRWLGARLATGPRHPVAGQPPGACTEQLGVPGPWYARLPHFRPEHVPSTGRELQSEYLVPRRCAVGALAAVDALGPRIAPLLQVSELRTVAGDDAWLSPAYRCDSLAIHFTWTDDAPAVLGLLTEVEERLAPFEARPHWGKLFRTDPTVLSGLYPRLADFGRVRGRYDPTGKFGNDLVDRYAPAVTR